MTLDVNYTNGTNDNIFPRSMMNNTTDYSSVPITWELPNIGEDFIESTPASTTTCVSATSTLVESEITVSSLDTNSSINFISFSPIPSHIYPAFSRNSGRGRRNAISVPHNSFISHQQSIICTIQNDIRGYTSSQASNNNELNEFKIILIGYFQGVPAYDVI
ncbi:uncharacterized protein NDAI_0F02340 [Naumovozyma dairenensis CBS 421]|uniref:Uncharacterized protein n=1 Tax=Naumovozyma dairenensis (strain ATCC 10597 / BCRC 20456 / CBS 421 / NBRC 0211 / NRRL Y-12639) TaxID=1071378 RepID=G0WCM7_NAUDC|nr:hypothetical protein NDAI_0F02200 [Naumovozyma dairenensis CBS 421]XP_003670795.1 hypothetical protein NDAI_0F02340 [Naumovozyma dairenensis CBS 421]CCD25538.1 hypothetical protein NDAI_0F02200 [Naumovozyma dairenensis CBS 421]CCD25552.1 hypothetical protein NDAI_0F02340 [Naumovozyma dairenensis CBS 421]